MRSHYKWTKKRTIYLIIGLLVLSLGFRIFDDQVVRNCQVVTSSNPQQYLNEQTNDKLLSILHKLGAQDPVTACTGDGLRGLFVIDGARSYVVKIEGSGKKEMEDLGCKVRSEQDTSNQEYTTYIHRAFRNKDIPTGYYSDESSDGYDCYAEDAQVIITTKDSKNRQFTYLLFIARIKTNK